MHRRRACDEHIQVSADHVSRAFAVGAFCRRSIRKLLCAGFWGCWTAIAALSVSTTIQSGRAADNVLLFLKAAIFIVVRVLASHFTMLLLQNRVLTPYAPWKWATICRRKSDLVFSVYSRLVGLQYSGGKK